MVRLVDRIVQLDCIEIAELGPHHDQATQYAHSTASVVQLQGFLGVGIIHIVDLQASFEQRNSVSTGDGKFTPIDRAHPLAGRNRGVNVVPIAGELTIIEGYIRE